MINGKCSVSQNDHLPFSFAVVHAQKVTELRKVFLAKLQARF